MTYYPGHVLRFSTTFTVSGTPTDPSTVTLTVAGPASSTSYLYGTDAEVIKSGTGAYYADITLSSAGVWRWRWVGTGAAANPDEGSVTVEPSLISTTTYCSRDDVKLARRGLPDALDELIDALIIRASATIDSHTGRRYGLTTTATDRFYLLAPYQRDRVVLIDDLSTTPTQAALVDEDEDDTTTLVVADDLRLLPRNRWSDQPITAVRIHSTAGWDYGLRIRGIWGWPVVPEVVREATVTTVADWLKDGQGLTPQSPNLLEPGMPPFRGLPQKARDLLRPLRRLGVA